MEKISDISDPEKMKQAVVNELEAAFIEAKEIADGKRNGFTIEEILGERENIRFGNGHKN